MCVWLHCAVWGILGPRRGTEPVLAALGVQSLNPWTAWRRDWLPTPVFLPWELHGQGSLAGYSLWGCKEWDVTEGLTLSLLLRCNTQFSGSVMSDSLRPHGLHRARLRPPSSTPRAHSNSCPLSRWCHPTISSSVVPFSSCLQSFPASESFPMSQLFTSGVQNAQNDRNYPKNWSTSFVCFISTAFLIDSYFAWIPPVAGNSLFWRRLSLSLFFFFFAAPDGLWGLSFHTSHGIWDSCKWKLESWPLDYQGIPREFIISLF